ncbi:MAG: hypothetical protein JNK11_00100, partial [Alphaproteobacteria bacterium]|nr:hypothetical protein [Alphaproteobacteria bacterium]
EGLLDLGVKIRSMVIPDRCFDHDKPEKQVEAAGLTGKHIVQKALEALRINSLGVKDAALRA